MYMMCYSGIKIVMHSMDTHSELSPHNMICNANKLTDLTPPNKQQDKFNVTLESERIGRKKKKIKSKQNSIK